MTKCTNCMRGDCCGGDFDALKAENAKLREAADKYSRWGHHEICQAIPDYNIKCVCGLAELEALITPSDTKPGPAPESSQEAPEKT